MLTIRARLIQFRLDKVYNMAEKKETEKEKAKRIEKEKKEIEKKLKKLRREDPFIYD